MSKLLTDAKSFKTKNTDKFGPSSSSKDGSTNSKSSKADKHAQKSGGSKLKFFTLATLFPLLAIFSLKATGILGSFDLLNGLDSDFDLSSSPLLVQTAVSGFCLSPAVGHLLSMDDLNPDRQHDGGWNGRGEANSMGEKFGKRAGVVETGNIEEDDYAQSSIYAILYALYKKQRLVSEYGKSYWFTFNTWGYSYISSESGLIGEGEENDDFELSDAVANNMASESGSKDSYGKYKFTTPYYDPKLEPQRHGKTAYRALVTQPPCRDYMKEKYGYDFTAGTSKTYPKLKVVEIGCGTGAGANLITREVLPGADYLALDMQQAAIDTCNKLHGNHENRSLKCKLVSGGVGNMVSVYQAEKNGYNQPGFNSSNFQTQYDSATGLVSHISNPVPQTPNSSVDFVIISETHIAELRIGDLEKRIFSEIRRILKPGGLFLWGNALPTSVWKKAEEVLPTLGFELAHSRNHTKGAVQARDEDKKRVELVLEQGVGQFPVMNVPYFGPRCSKLVKMLIFNFYRHPGTAMYMKMVQGFDSYMRQAWRVVK